MIACFSTILNPLIPMVYSKKSNSRIVLMATCTSEPPKRYSIFRSEKVFLVALGLLTILSAVVFFGLLIGAINQLPVLWSGMLSTISNLEQSLSVPAFVAIIGSIVALFFLIKLIQLGMQLFQAFWDSLDVD